MARFKKSNKINFLHYYFKTDDDFDNWSDSIWDVGLDMGHLEFCKYAILFECHHSKRCIDKKCRNTISNFAEALPKR